MAPQWTVAFFEAAWSALPASAWPEIVRWAHTTCARRSAAAHRALVALADEAALGARPHPYDQLQQATQVLDLILQWGNTIPDEVRPRLRAHRSDRDASDRPMWWGGWPGATQPLQALQKLASQLQALPAWQRLIPQLTAGLAHPAPRVQAVVRALLRNLNATHPNELVFSLLAGSMDGTEGSRHAPARMLVLLN